MNTTTARPDPKVLVIGLDAASLELIRPWAAEGKLPAFSRLMQEGTWGPLNVQLPPSSVPNWPSFMTGKNPGKHGVLWWMEDTDALDDAPVVDRRSIKGAALWDIAGAAGKQVAVVNVPVTYPPSPVNGAMVTGLLTPASAVDFTYPLELKAELDAAVGGYRLYHDAVYREHGETAFLDDLLDVLQRRLQASLHLMQSRPWDLFVVVFTATDIAMHKFWKDMDPGHPLYRAEQAQRAGDALLHIYEAADRAVAALLDAAGDDTHVIVMSDHGSGGFYEAFFPNKWLMDQGLLKIRRHPVSQARYLLYRLGLTVHTVYPIANALMAKLGGQNLRRRFSPRNTGGGIVSKLFLSQRDIDWSRTKAYAVGDFGQIRVNLRGRNKQGIVAPGAEYDAVREQIIDKLYALKVPSTGQPYVKQIYKKEEMYQGPEVDKLPDLICVPYDERYVDTGMGFASNRLFDTIPMISGTHRCQGALFLKGPDVRVRPELQDASILDLAPTVLYLLGLPVPDDMDGQVLVAALREERLSRQPIQSQATAPVSDGAPPSEAPPSEAPPSEARDLSHEETDEVKNRLRSLGYIS